MPPCHQFANTGTCTYGARCKFTHAGKKSVSYSRLGSSNHLIEFFANYESFSYDPSAPVMEQFYQMCDLFGWNKDDPEKLEARAQLSDAITQQFNDIYGTDEDDVGSWQNLCRVLRISVIPDDLEECKRLLRSKHVNLVDLVDSPNTGQRIHLFGSELLLSKYTKKAGKYFPQDNAYAGGLLRFLLRHILNPQQGHRPPRNARGTTRSRRRR